MHPRRISQPIFQYFNAWLTSSHTYAYDNMPHSKQIREDALGNVARVASALHRLHDGLIG